MSRVKIMDFCETCDSLLQPKKAESGEVLAYCPDCEEFKEEGNIGTISIKDEDREGDPEGGKMLVLEEQSNRTVGRPSKDMFCPNCEDIQDVEYWEIQTRSADEAPTRFFKCLTCGKNWREYD